MRFFYHDVTAVGRGTGAGQYGAAAISRYGFQTKVVNGQQELCGKDGKPITQFKTREEYHFAKKFLETKPKTEAFIKLSNKLDGYYNANEGLGKSVYIDPANKQQVIIFGKKYQIPPGGLDMKKLKDAIREQAGLGVKEGDGGKAFNKILKEKCGLEEVSQTKAGQSKTGNIDLGDGYSYKLNPPTLIKGNNPITKIESPEEYKKIKAVLNKYHAQSSVLTRPIADRLINHADNLYASQVKEVKGKIFIFGIEQKTEVRPDVKVIRKSLMEGKSVEAAVEDGLKATGTSIRLEDLKKADGKYSVGETIFLFHQGKKIDGLVTEVKQDNGIKKIRVHHKESDTFFEVTIKTVNGKDDLKSAKVKHLGSEWTFGEVKKAEHEGMNIRAKQVLGGEDPYDLKRFNPKEKVSKTDSDKLVQDFQKTMAQFEDDLLTFIISRKDASSAGDVKKYLERMESLLRKAGMSEENIRQIMVQTLKKAFQYAEYIRDNAYDSVTMERGVVLCQVLENYSSKQGVDLKKTSPIPWGEIWKMINKPSTVHFVTPDWRTKGAGGKTLWDKEKQKISDDIKTDQAALMNISQDLVAKHGSKGLPVDGLQGIKMKETRVLLAKEFDPFTKKFKEEGSSQTLKEYVITGYSPKDKKFVVIEPSTGARFEGDTADEAMEAYCKGSALNENSIISYRDSKGVIRQHTVEYSLGKRLVDSAYRAAVALVVVGTVAATFGAGTPLIIVATAGGATMAAIDTGELVVKAANGQQTTWKDWTMAGVDTLFSIVLPGLSKLGKFAKVNFLAKHGFIDKTTAESLKKLSKTNPAEYEEQLAKMVHEAYQKKPEAFVKAVKVTSKEMANPYRKGELQVEKVYLEGADGKLTQMKSRHTNLSEEEALEKYAAQIEKGEIISGENFVLAKQNKFKGQPVFHIHPKITVKAQYAQGTFAGDDIGKALKNMGVSEADIISAAGSDGKVRIICKVEGKGYAAITAEIEFTADGKRVLKSMTTGKVAFNKGPKFDTHPAFEKLDDLWSRGVINESNGFTKRGDHFLIDAKKVNQAITEGKLNEKMFSRSFNAFRIRFKFFTVDKMGGFKPVIPPTTKPPVQPVDIKFDYRIIDVPSNKPIMVYGKPHSGKLEAINVKITLIDTKGNKNAMDMWFPRPRNEQEMRTLLKNLNEVMGGTKKLTKTINGTIDSYGLTHTVETGNKFDTNRYAHYQNSNKEIDTLNGQLKHLAEQNGWKISDSEYLGYKVYD